jgi:dihydropteroate synthase
MGDERPEADVWSKARVWDVVEPDELDLFLSGSRLRLPVSVGFPGPCRAVRFERPPNAPDIAKHRPPAVHLAEADGEILLVGPARRLRETAHRWGCVDGSHLIEVLDRYERAPSSIPLPRDRALDASRRTLVMGVINVTPDSFSDGGLHEDPQRALDRALRLIDEGADLLDVGGESTRPGARPVDEIDEARRVLPVVRAIRDAAPEAPVFVDTRRASVARGALDEGADGINDVSALADPQMATVVAERGVPLVLMHMRGTPESMQKDTRYDDLVGEILAFLSESARRARSAGIAGDRILLDPGIGFGKSFVGNEIVLRQLRTFRSLGLPLLVGASRKAFVGHRTGVEPPDERLAGSLAAALVAAHHGAAVVRVHDVRATREALAVSEAVRSAMPGRETSSPDGKDGTRG